MNYKILHFVVIRRDSCLTNVERIARNSVTIFITVVGKYLRERVKIVFYSYKKISSPMKFNIIIFIYVTHIPEQLNVIRFSTRNVRFEEVNHYRPHLKKFTFRWFVPLSVIVFVQKKKMSTHTEEVGYYRTWVRRKKTVTLEVQRYRTTILSHLYNLFVVFDGKEFFTRVNPCTERGVKARLYSTLLYSTRLDSTRLDSTRLYSTLFDSTPLYSTLLNSTRLNSIASTRLYSTLLNSIEFDSIQLNRVNSTLLDSTEFNPTQLNWVDSTLFDSTEFNSTQLNRVNSILLDSTE